MIWSSLSCHCQSLAAKVSYSRSKGLTQAHAHNDEDKVLQTVSTRESPQLNGKLTQGRTSGKAIMIRET